MTLQIPLSVRLRTARGDRIVTASVRDLAFRSVVPGGYAACTISLHRPLSVQPDEIDYYATLTVYDARSAETVWEGRVEDLGRGAGADGQIWDIAAVGPSAHAHDRTLPLIYVDRRHDVFKPNQFHKQYVSVDTVGADTTPAIRTTVRNGSAISLGIVSDLVTIEPYLAGQKIARLSYTWDAGFSGGGTLWLTRWLTYTGPAGTEVVAASVSPTTSGGTLTAKLVSDGGAIVNGNDVASIDLVKAVSTTTVTDDAVWLTYWTIVVRTLLLTKAGAEITTGYTADTVLASEVVADLLGRVLTAYDGANASITTTSYAITQLAYPDGADAAKVLGDLLTFEPDTFWAAWELNPVTGKYRFEYSTWPTTVRYEADIADGFDSPGSATDLYNAVRVRYREDDGQLRTVQRTQTVAALTAAGLTREAFLDLGDELGGAANANRAGDQFLAQHAAPPNAGTLIIGRRILDVTAGRMVDPWLIKPGALIRVRGVLPRVDALNATARDGVTVFRVVGVTYRASTGTAELELDSMPVTVAGALAAAGTSPDRRR